MYTFPFFDAETSELPLDMDYPSFIRNGRMYTSCPPLEMQICLWIQKRTYSCQSFKPVGEGQQRKARPTPPPSRSSRQINCSFLLFPSLRSPSTSLVKNVLSEDHNLYYYIMHETVMNCKESFSSQAFLSLLLEIPAVCIEHELKDFGQFFKSVYTFGHGGNDRALYRIGIELRPATEATQYGKPIFHSTSEDSVHNNCQPTFNIYAHSRCKR